MDYGTLEEPINNSTSPLLPGGRGQQQIRQRRTSQGVSSRNIYSSGQDRFTESTRVRTKVRSQSVLQEILAKPQKRVENRPPDGTIPEETGIGDGNDQNAPFRSNKSFLYTMLNPRSEAWQANAFKWFISVVIIADLVTFVISTEPDLTQEQILRFEKWEGITSVIFLIEYLARLLTVTESKKYGGYGQIMGRLRYAVTSPALIDFAATVPFFLELLSGWDLPTLTYLRAFRLLRILKTNGFSEATRAVYRVMYYNRQILYVALLISIGLILVTAVLMYYLRPQDPDYSRDFQSLGATLYLSTLMLTGQGGPEGDLPWYTKGVVLLTGVFSIGMFSLLVSMITWGFEAEAERCARQAYAVAKKKSDDSDNDNWSYSSDEYDTDEEYVKIIAGGDESDEEANAVEAFQLADADGSGNISLTEFLELSRKRAAEDAAHNTKQSSELTLRMAQLEKQVEENSQKLDKICQLLESMQKAN